jgi:hypothetical protein
MSVTSGASTENLSQLIHPNDGLLVLGSLNANPQDRYLERSQIQPVQLIDHCGIRPVPFFAKFGRLGVSSLACHPNKPSRLYVTTGNELLKVEPLERRIVDLKVPRLQDVHEITMVGHTLWLANTGYDEALAFDVSRECVSRRVTLTAYASKSNIEENNAWHRAEKDTELVDRFHCNQVFEGFDGELYALVHHVSGKQIMMRLVAKTKKIVKRQGNGGVVGLSNGRRIPLGLRGPHTVRKVDGNYWVFDSGNATLNIYGPTWKLKEKLSTEGYGRGASNSRELGLFYAGVSETRKRYVKLERSHSESPNMVLVFSTKTKKSLGKVVLSGIEQVNNIYTVPSSTALALLNWT